MPESAEEAYHRTEDLDPSWEIFQTLHSEGEQFPSMEKNLMDNDFMNKLEGNSSNVKNRLTRDSPFWEGIGVNSFVLRILKEGYVLSFVEEPSEFKTMASMYSKFVSDEIEELETTGRIREVIREEVHTVSPLGVVDNGSKLCLILT